MGIVIPSVPRNLLSEHTEIPKATSRLMSVLTDLHFWVPVAVLLAGLLLLSFMH